MLAVLIFSLLISFCWFFFVDFICCCSPSPSSFPLISAVLLVCSVCSETESPSLSPCRTPVRTPSPPSVPRIATPKLGSSVIKSKHQVRSHVIIMLISNFTNGDLQVWPLQVITRGGSVPNAFTDMQHCLVKLLLA